MHKPDETIRQFAAGKGKRSLAIPAAIGLLFATGVPLWFPSLYHLVAGISGPMLFLHIAAGVFFSIVFVPLWMKSRREKRSFAPLGFSSGTIIVCLWLLALSGAGLAVSRLFPHSIGKTLIFIHGAASFLLLTVIAVRLSFIAATRRAVKGEGRSV